MPVERLDRRILAGAVIAMLLVVGLGWTIASPLGASPDDDFHMASIWCSATAPSDKCEVVGADVGNGQRNVLVPNAISSPRVGCFAFKGMDSAECLHDFDDEPAVARANGGSYPNGYYALLGLLVTDRPVRSVLSMRMFSWVICVGIIALSLWLARPRVRALFTIGVLSTSLPLMVFVFASVNPSAPVIAGTVACGCAVVSWTEAHRRRPSLLAFALSVAAVVLALAARPDASVWLAVAVVLVCVLQLRALRDRPARLVLPGLLLLMCAVMALRFSRFAAGFDEDVLPRPFGQVVFRNVTDLPLLWTGSLGSTALGWFDTPMPAVVWAGMIVLFGALLFTGIRWLDREKGGALLLGVGALVVLPLYFLAQGGNVIPENVQPRYVLPLMPIVLTVGIWRRRNEGEPLLSRSQLVAAAVVLSTAHAAALHTNLRRYVRGLAEDGFGLDGDQEWWWRTGPPSPMLVWVVTSLCFAGAVSVLLALTAGWGLGSVRADDEAHGDVAAAGEPTHDPTATSVGDGVRPAEASSAPIRPA